MFLVSIDTLSCKSPGVLCQKYGTTSISSVFIIFIVNSFSPPRKPATPCNSFQYSHAKARIAWLGATRLKMSVTSENTQGQEDIEKHTDFGKDDDEKHVQQPEMETRTKEPETAALAIIESATAVSPPVDTAGKTPGTADDDDFTPDHATGVALVMAMMAINLSVFLMFLDNSILATVSIKPLLITFQWISGQIRSCY